MKYIIISGVVFLLSLSIAVYLNANLNYFSSDFESSNYWLMPSNPNLSGINSFESFTTKIDLIDFPKESSIFATLSYKDKYLDYQDISIPWDLVGKSIYSVNNEGEIRVLNTNEVIKAVSEWRTEYTFEVTRSDLATNKYNILQVYIHEPI